jgi:hypothetical protein
MTARTCNGNDNDKNDNNGKNSGNGKIQRSLHCATDVRLSVAQWRDDVFES